MPLRVRLPISSRANQTACCSYCRKHSKMTNFPCYFRLKLFILPYAVQIAVSRAAASAVMEAWYAAIGDGLESEHGGKSYW